jgi:hypothetical protein
MEAANGLQHKRFVAQIVLVLRRPDFAHQMKVATDGAKASSGRLSSSSEALFPRSWE